jgi:PAS domain S-box-containing protein
LKDEFLAMAFRLSPHPMGVTELETGRCLDINDACLEMFGFRRDEVIGQATLLLGILPDPQDRARLIERLESERSVRNLDVPMRMKHGDLRHFLISADVVMLGKTRCLLMIGNDITEHKRAEEALRDVREELERRVRERTGELERTNAALIESEERFRTFLDHAANLAFIKTTDGRYLYVNRRFEEAFRLDHNSIVGRTDEELFPREQADQFRADDRSALEAGAAMEFEETPCYADGLHTTIAVKFPMRDKSGNVYAIGGIVTDINERKRVEQTLRDHQLEQQQHRVELQHLASRLIKAQESERQRIARELHDDVSQRLAALVFDVASLEQHPPLLPELIGKALEPVREQLERLSDDLHDLAYKLHPSLLEHAGLQPAIEDQIREVTKRTGLSVSWKVNPVPGSLSLDHSTCLFRVLQESLQNVVKHACATEATVKLSGSSKGVGLSVTDNGKGFDTSDTSTHHNGLGLTSMQERLRLLNGFLRVHSRPADGTKVCAWIPFEKDKA